MNSVIRVINDEDYEMWKNKSKRIQRKKRIYLNNNNDNNDINQ